MAAVAGVLAVAGVGCTADDNPTGSPMQISVPSGIQVPEFDEETGLSNDVPVDALPVGLIDDDNAPLFETDGTSVGTDVAVWEAAAGVRNAVIVSGEANDGDALRVTLPLDAANTFVDADGRNLIVVAGDCSLNQVREIEGEGRRTSDDEPRQFGLGTELTPVASIRMREADRDGFDTLFGFTDDQSIVNGDRPLMAAELLPQGGPFVVLSCTDDRASANAAELIVGGINGDDDDSTNDGPCSVEVLQLEDAGNGVTVAVPEWAFNINTLDMVDMPGGDMVFPLEAGSQVGLVMTGAQGGPSQLRVVPTGDCNGLRVGGQAFFDQSQPPSEEAVDAILNEAMFFQELMPDDSGVYTAIEASDSHAEGWGIAR